MTAFALIFQMSRVLDFLDLVPTNLNINRQLLMWRGETTYLYASVSEGCRRHYVLGLSVHQYTPDVVSPPPPPLYFCTCPCLCARRILFFHMANMVVPCTCWNEFPYRIKSPIQRRIWTWSFLKCFWRALT